MGSRKSMFKISAVDCLDKRYNFSIGFSLLETGFSVYTHTYHRVYTINLELKCISDIEKPFRKSYEKLFCRIERARDELSRK